MGPSGRSRRDEDDGLIRLQKVDNVSHTITGAAAAQRLVEHMLDILDIQDPIEFGGNAAAAVVLSLTLRHTGNMRGMLVLMFLNMMITTLTRKPQEAIQDTLDLTGAVHRLENLLTVCALEDVFSAQRSARVRDDDGFAMSTS